MTDTIGLVMIAAGLVFDVLGCLGLIRLPDVYNRLQASTKCVTLGTCSILIGTFLITGFTSTGFKALLAVFFLVLTSPVSAHAISRGAHKAGIKLWKGSACDALEERDKEAQQ
ncbi:MAG: monovalent cation/H(+) antiporter subunit G [Candidatus Fermentibacteraceae bacterium]|jgi:multicomponent Na+:H+ antiporter subunit G